MVWEGPPSGSDRWRASSAPAGPGCRRQRIALPSGGPAATVRRARYGPGEGALLDSDDPQRRTLGSTSTRSSSRTSAPSSSARRRRRRPARRGRRPRPADPAARRPAGRPDPRRGRPQPRGASSTRTSTRSTRSRASSTSWPPGRRSSRRPSDGVPAGRARPLQPVRGDRRQPELRAGAARRRAATAGSCRACTRAPGTRVYAKAIAAGRADAGAVRGGDRPRSGRRRPDRLAVTAAGDAPDMAPTTPPTPAADAVTRAADARPRREPVAARPAAGLARPRPGHGPGARRPPPSRARGAARRARTRTSSGRSPTATGRCSSSPAPGPARPRSSPGGSPGSSRPAGRSPSEILALTFTDKAAEEMAVRVDQLVPYGYTDTAISTFHAFGDGLIREYALELGPADRRARPVAAGGRHLPARAPVRVRARRLPAARRPDPLPRRAGHAVQPLQGRGHRARPTTWPTPTGWRPRRPRLAELRPTAGRRRRGPRTAAAARRGGGRARPSWPAPTRRYQGLLAANGCIDFGDQVALALRLVRDVGRGARRRSPAGSATSSSTSSRTRTGPRRSWSPLLAEAHRNVTVVGDDDQAIYAFRGAADRQHPRLPGPLPRGADGRPAAQLPVARADPRRRLPADPVQRPGPARGPDRGRQAAAGRSASTPTPAPVRLEAFATGVRGGGLDRRRDRPADRGRRRAARPRGPRPGQRPRRPDPAGAQHGRHPVAVLGDVGAVRPARGPAPARVPARRRRPRVERRPLRARGLGGVRARRRGPDRDRQHGPPPQPLGLGGPRGARRAAGHPARRARRRGRPSIALVADLRALRRRSPTSGRPASCCTRFLRGSGLLARLVGDRHAGRRGGAPEHRPLLRDRPRRSRRCSPTTARSSWRRHLATLIEAGDDPATAELDPDADAVAVLTVHKAKGLEFPVVFLPGMVAGRFPSGGRGDPLALPAGLGRGAPPTPEAALAEERRLCYVAMTRARDELILSHAADYGGARARRVSPFVLEALDLPAAAGVPGAGARAATPARAPGRVRARPHRPRAPRTGPIDRAAVAELLPGRRLPDLPAQVQVRPRPAGPARAAPRDRLRRGPPQGGPAVPPPARPGPRHERGGARRGRSSRPGRTRGS